jgi:phospholipid/cholesterol/gamma-HCH transport system substrate-binding protein
MKRDALEFRIGLFVTSGLVVLLVMIIAFGEMSLFRREYRVVGVFNGSVGNVTRGAPVRLAGVDIGKAADIKLDKRGNVRAYLRIYEEFTIKKDAALLIKQDGILGECYFEFGSGSDKADELPKTGKVEVPGTVQTSLGDMAPKFSEMMKLYEPKVTVMLDNLNKSIIGLNTIIADQKTQENFRNTMRYASETLAKGPVVADNVNTTMTEATATMKKIGALVDDLKGTVASANATIASAKAQIGDVGKSYNDLARDLRALSAKTEVLLNSMQRLVGESRGESTVGKLLTEDKLYQKLVETLDEARTTLAQVKQTFQYLEENPTALYWGDKSKRKVTEQKPFWKRIFTLTPTTAKEETSKTEPEEPEKVAPDEAKPSANSTTAPKPETKSVK